MLAQFTPSMDPPVSQLLSRYMFVSLSVKAVHLELVSNLTTEALFACLRRFIARRGKPSLI